MIFMIIGHGKLSVHEDDYYVNMFESPNVNVITFAPPTAGCMYPPENLAALREGLSKDIKSVTNAQSFYEYVKGVEKQTQEWSYCDKEWLGYFSKEAGYDPSKGCGLQIDTILDKTISFHDASIESNLMGVWDLEKNENIMSEGNSTFSNIVQLLRAKHPKGPIYILDCTCSVLMDETNRIISPRLLHRFKRRAQRQITTRSKKTKAKTKFKTRAKAKTRSKTRSKTKAKSKANKATRKNRK
jgi:hypothetical protein